MPKAKEVTLGDAIEFIRSYVEWYNATQGQNPQEGPGGNPLPPPPPPPPFG